MSESRAARENRAALVIDDLPLSPELVLVSPPDLAWHARAALAEPLVRPTHVERGLSRGEVAAAYAVALGVTLVPLALTLLALPSRS
jgi:hypothetical protein